MDWYRRNRERSATLFALIDDEAFYDRPIPLRHPFAFYEGHIPAFSFLTLNERGLGEAPIDPASRRSSSAASIRRRSTRRGATTAPTGPIARDRRGVCRRSATSASSGRSSRRASTMLACRGSFAAQAAYTILEHEAMHQETLMYIVHQLAYDRKRRIARQHEDHARSAATSFAASRRAPQRWAPIRTRFAFGWDNEFRRTEVEVAALRHRGVSGHQRRLAALRRRRRRRYRTSGSSATASGCCGCSSRRFRCRDRGRST